MHLFTEHNGERRWMVMTVGTDTYILSQTRYVGSQAWSPWHERDRSVLTLVEERNEARKLLRMFLNKVKALQHVETD